MCPLWDRWVAADVEIVARVGDRTAGQGFEAYEPAVGLADCRRLDLVDVPGVGESAVDWSFTFRGAGGSSRWPTG